MDDESKAASEAKNDEIMQGLEDEKGEPIGRSRVRLGRISEDPKGTQEPFLSRLEWGHTLEPAGTDWEDGLSENSSVDWRQNAARGSTTFPQLSPLLKKRKRSTREKGVRPSGRGLSEMLGYDIGPDPTLKNMQPAGQRAKFVL